jgi:O-acetyl-ADP-ribose deacetylase (regulator of RNase III)
MKSIIYLKVDATAPNQAGNQIIAHICNDIGGWGKGFVLAISKRWKEPEKAYRNWHKQGSNFALGQVQLVQVEEKLWVANMIAQRGISTIKNPTIPIQYDAVLSCLETLSIEANKLNASVSMPRIGCGLAGGKWEIVEPLIIQTLCKNDIDTFIYDF